MFKPLTALGLSLALLWPATVAAQTTIPYDQLPKYTHNGTGGTSQPINFIWVGTAQQIHNRFVSHGWYTADPATPTNLIKAYQAAKYDLPYPTAPFSPAFIGFDKHDLAFQLPTETNSVRQRHHTRIWNSELKTSDGRQVWVGTASYDDSIRYINRTTIPVHHIDPNVDVERDFIMRSLGIKTTRYVQTVPPQTGTNTFGDQFVTDGRAVVIMFKKPSGSTQAAQPIQSKPASSVKPVSGSVPQGALDRLHNFLSSAAEKAGLPQHLF